MAETSRDIALDLVDLDAFPIANLDDETGAQFLAKCRKSMDAHG